MLYDPSWDEGPGGYRPQRYIPPPPLPMYTWWGIGFAVGVLVALLVVAACTHAMNYEAPRYQQRAYVSLQ